METKPQEEVPAKLPLSHEKDCEKPTGKKRAARCLICSHEWWAINGHNKKPSKCTECGSRKCAWKDELTKEPEKTQDTRDSHENEPAKVEDSHEKDCEESGETVETPAKVEDSHEKEHENPKVAAATTTFPQISHEKEGEIDDGKFRPPQGLPLLLVFGLLLVLGIVGGAVWFLGRRPRMGGAPVPTVPRQPSKAEGVAMRLAGGA